MCLQLKEHAEEYYVICGVRDTQKMVEAANKAGLSPKDYTAVELQLASFQSVKDFAQDLKKTCASALQRTLLQPPDCSSWHPL